MRPFTTLAFLAASASAWAQSELQVKVIEVKGSAEYRTAVDKPWQTLKQGASLAPGAWIQTGLKSRVYVKFGDNTVVQIKSASLVEVFEAARDGKKMTGRLKLALGSVHVEVDKSDQIVDFKIITPQVTTSVKGTGFDVRTSSDLRTTRVDVQHGRVRTDNGAIARNVEKGKSVDSLLLPSDVKTVLDRVIPSVYDTLVYTSKEESQNTTYTYEPSRETYTYTTLNTQPKENTTPGNGTEPAPITEEGGGTSPPPIPLGGQVDLLP